jgi:hypothetical protein
VDWRVCDSNRGRPCWWRLVGIVMVMMMRIIMVRLLELLLLLLLLLRMLSIIIVVTLLLWLVMVGRMGWGMVIIVAIAAAHRSTCFLGWLGYNGSQVVMGITVGP